VLLTQWAPKSSGMTLGMVRILQELSGLATKVSIVLVRGDVNFPSEYLTPPLSSVTLGCDVGLELRQGAKISPPGACRPQNQYGRNKG